MHADRLFQLRAAVHKMALNQFPSLCVFPGHVWHSGLRYGADGLTPDGQTVFSCKRQTLHLRNHDVST